MSDNGEEYEYEDDLNADEDEEYNYEDGDAEDNEDVNESRSSEQNVSKSPEEATKSANLPAGTSSASRKSPGQPLVHNEKNSLIRATSNSFELVVPTDSYVIRPLSDISPLLTALVNEVANLLDLTEDESQAILQHFKWDKERLTDSYFSNSEKVRKECGIDLWSPAVLHSLLTSSSSSSSTPLRSSAAMKNGKFKCRICCDDECEVKDSFALGCDHKFCRSCFSEYLHTAIADGAHCVTVHCPEHKCKQLVTKSIVHHLVSAEESGKYDSYFLRDFIEKSKNMKYCPAPRCEKVAVGSGITTIRCACNYCFCFKCGEEAHDPASCPQLADWTEKCMNESETANWILANTRKCPNCTTRIEKNQGCNHMTCKMCKHEFCWICMGTWSEHGQNTGGFYKCNRYDAADANTAVTAAQKAKQELDRYLHYYQRYHGHDSGLKFAAKQREQAEAKMIEQQQTKGASWIDVQFLIQATEQIIDCRRVLKYTYVLGYFLPDNSPEKKLFEYQQEMLEKNVEKLHEYSEKPVHQVDRIQVVNLTRVTEKFLSSLLQNMTGGIVRLDEASMAAMAFDSSSSSSAAANPVPTTSSSSKTSSSGKKTPVK